MTVIRFVPIYILIMAPIVGAAIYGSVTHMTEMQQNGLLMLAIPANIAWVCLVLLVREMLIALGTEYQSRGKHPRLCTVTDILRTYNAAGEMVRVRYVATHPGPLGQIVTDHDVCDATIGLGLHALGRPIPAPKGWAVAETAHGEG